jgi:hypothetical protein
LHDFSNAGHPPELLELAVEPPFPELEELVVDELPAIPPPPAELAVDAVLVEDDVDPPPPAFVPDDETAVLPEPPLPAEE